MSEETAAEVLLVEDDPQDLTLALRALKKARFSDRIHVARDGAAALEFVFGEDGPTA